VSTLPSGERAGHPGPGSPEHAAADEMRTATGDVRPLWTGLAGVLDAAGPAGLAARRADTERLLADDGVAYHPPGAEAEQLWELDPLPLILDGADWSSLQVAVAQRAELADRLLADLYGPRDTIRRGLVPVEVVDGHPGYLHAWRRPAGTVPRRELFLCGVDLGRSPDGWVVLDDRVQAPSGAGYAMANRRVVARVLSALHRRSRIRRLGPFFEAMRADLAAEVPGADGPRTVLLTPGPHSETAYEQALLSSLLGVPLVLGSELTVRDGRVWQHTLGRLEPVDVVLRRLDAQWCDPLDLRPDSRLGVPGLTEAARLGTVSVLNGLGSGVRLAAGRRGPVLARPLLRARRGHHPAASRRRGPVGGLPDLPRAGRCPRPRRPAARDDRDHRHGARLPRRRPEPDAARRRAALAALRP
jgi:uncharacterized circularly permuted ATP-grasp superfamily protein